MDWQLIAPVLGGAGAAFGAFATIQQQRASNLNRRFEMLFDFQGKDLARVMAENEDFRTRMTSAEQELRNCERDKHNLSLQVQDLKFTVEGLKEIISAPTD